MDWHQKIIDLLSGAAFGIPPERLDWTGYISVYKLFSQVPVTEHEVIIQAMTQVIREAATSRNEQAWRLASDIMHLGYSLGIHTSTFRDAVKKLAPERAPTDALKDAATYARNTYLNSLRPPKVKVPQVH